MGSFWARSSKSTAVDGGEAEIEWRHLVEREDAGAIPSAIEGYYSTWLFQKKRPY
jgi:hypothetical protein